MSTQPDPGVPRQHGFSDEGSIPFVMGDFYGHRAFTVLPTGEITGTIFHAIWKPGENLAYCLKEDHKDAQYLHRYVINPKLLPIGPTHDFPSCSCGFWAYWGNRANTYAAGYHDRISGVIHAYGRMVFAEYGFRCTKAVIKALAIPKQGPFIRDDLSKDQFYYLAADRIIERYPDIMIFDNPKTMLEEFPPTHYDEVKHVAE